MRRSILQTSRGLQPSSANPTTLTPSISIPNPAFYRPNIQRQPHNIPPTIRSASSSTTTSSPSKNQHKQESQTPTSPSSKTPINTDPQEEPVLPKTYFSLFPLSFPNGAPPASSFTPNLRTLHTEYLRLQAIAHPDRHHTSSSSQTSTTKTATQDNISANINSAYKTLQSPLSRATYLLQQQGIDIETEGVMEADKSLLTSILSAREEIEEAENETQIQDLKIENDERVRHCIQGIEDNIREGKWQDVAEWAVKLRYWSNIGESLKGWEKGKGVILTH
ncbi:MAG: hypothetical protein M1812_006234 [Candelaria pacifica]|nr:MAG: hypothetical protein M1812_006234 [Candelaria pacifica]